MPTSLQCGRQIAQLKEEYEEAKKILEAEVTKLRQVGVGEILMVKCKRARRKYVELQSSGFKQILVGQNV